MTPTRVLIFFLTTIFFVSAHTGESLGGSSVPRYGFQVEVVNPDSQFSAAACFDVDGDGHKDIVCGGFWYRGPKWERIKLRDVQRIGDRYDDYSNLPLDVDGDGDLDLVSANYRSSTIYWVEQPENPRAMWRIHFIARPGRSETAILADVDGDGQPDVLPNGVNYAGWFQRFLFRAAQTAPSFCWLQRALPTELAGHGIGAGDIDGDGRIDIVGRSGWAKQVRDGERIRWQFRPEFRLHRDASIPILVVDVDRDGDKDIVYGRGHNVGLYWLERKTSSSGEGKTWHLHCIDHTISQVHAILWGDINGDGWPELLAGKRYLPHGGRDPGEYDPLVVRAYQFLPGKRSWAVTTIAWDKGGWDLDPELSDVDGDGDLDLIGPTRAGLYLFRNGLQQRLPYRDPTPSIEDVPLYPDRHLLLTLRTPQGTRPITRKNLFDWGRKRFHILRNMERVMGPLPGPERRVPLNVRVLKRERTPRYDRLLIRYTPEPGDEVPAYLLIPHEVQAPAPAVLVLHQTVNVGKDEVVALGGRPNRQFAHELANRGYICLAPDYPSFGEYRFDFTTQGAHYASGTMKAIWNNIRAMDLLESLDLVDPDRIAAFGHSLGGHNALFTAAFDQRIRAVVTSCGFTGFEHYYGGNLRGWSQRRYMPRVAALYHNNPREMPFDFHDVLAAIAPRPIFINAPLGDHNFYNEGVWDVLDAVYPVYELFGAEKNLIAIFPDYGHDFLPAEREQAYRFLDRVLGHEAAR